MTRSKWRLELTGTSVFLMVGIVAVVLATGFPPASRLVPVSIGGTMIAFALAQGVRMLRARPPDGPPVEPEPDDPDSGTGVELLLDAASRRRTATILILSTILVGLIPLVGFPMAIGVYLVVALVSTASVPKWVAVLCAVSAFGLVYLLFDMLLELEPFDGLIFGML